MNTTYKVLLCDADLFAAALAEADIYVLQLREGKPPVFADCAGPLQKWTPEYIELGGMTYRRKDFEFRVRIPEK
ncbi:hypothetical protein D3C80_1712750 [compost metagenome]